MSVEHSPQHDIAYHFVAYDADGREHPGEHGLASTELAEAAGRERPTDVFFFSHGWNANPLGATSQYGHWVDAMAARTGDRERLRSRAGGFRPLLAGVHWPSKAWADEDLTGMSYAVGDARKAVAPAARAVDSVSDPISRLVAAYAEQLGDSPTVRDAIRTIFESALEDAAPPTLPDDVRDAYEQLDANIGLAQAGEGAAPGDDREPFDAEETYQAALLMDVAGPLSFSGFSLGGLLAPLRVLSFWTMKSRARTCGETGVSELLGRLQDAAPDARFHVMGHSFGCIVASAAIAGEPGLPGPRRKVDTLILAQGAMSLWSFCKSIPANPGREGYFRAIIRDELVRGPTIVTTSVHDRAVRFFYPIGAGARGDVAFGLDKLPVYGGIGTFGVRGPGIEIRDEQLERIDDGYRLLPGVVYNLNANGVISVSKGISGAHSDICHPEVARAVWRAAEGVGPRPGARPL
jgi:hypothetical protein